MIILIRYMLYVTLIICGNTWFRLCAKVIRGWIIRQQRSSICKHCCQRRWRENTVQSDYCHKYAIMGAHIHSGELGQNGWSNISTNLLSLNSSAMALNISRYDSRASSLWSAIYCCANIELVFSDPTAFKISFPTSSVCWRPTRSFIYRSPRTTPRLRIVLWPSFITGARDHLPCIYCWDHLGHDASRRTCLTSWKTMPTVCSTARTLFSLTQWGPGIQQQSLLRKIYNSEATIIAGVGA